jgi:hypothetical protein
MLVLFCSFFKPEQILSRIRQHSVFLRNNDQSPYVSTINIVGSDRVGVERQQFATWLPQ